MKRLHEHNLCCWSAFDGERNPDFHGVLWARPLGHVAIDREHVSSSVASGVASESRRSEP